MRRRTIIAAIASALSLSALRFAAAQPPAPSPASLTDALRQGGYVLT
jgi:hypothetical protein